MTTRTLSKTEWQSYFDRFSKDLEGVNAQVEILGRAVGDQKLVGQWIPMLGIVYEPRKDQLEIALRGLDHMIAHPQGISVVEGTEGPESIEIVDGDHLRQLVTLRRSEILPVS